MFTFLVMTPLTILYRELWNDLLVNTCHLGTPYLMAWWEAELSSYYRNEQRQILCL